MTITKRKRVNNSGRAQALRSGSTNSSANQSRARSATKTGLVASSTTKRHITTTRTATESRRSSGPASLDTESRSVVATIATDTPVRIYDWREDEEIDEVLVPAGFIAPRRMRLRVDHRTYGSENVIGRVDDFKITKKTVEATLRFSSADDVNPIYQRVADGSLDEVSIGARYDMKDTVRIEPGESKEVDGVTYRADKKVAKRIVRKWFGRETSVVDEGADPKATIRSKKASRRALAPVVPSRSRSRQTLDARRKPSNLSARSATKNPPLSGESGYEKRESGTARRRTVHSTNTTRTGSNSVPHSEGHTMPRLKTKARRKASAPAQTSRGKTTRTTEAPEPVVSKRSKAEANPNPKRKQSATRSQSRQTVDSTGSRSRQTLDDASNLSARSATKQVIAAERARIARIREIAGNDVPEKVVNRAIDNGYSVTKAKALFFSHLQTASDKPMRQAGNGVTRSPAGHVKGGVTLEALQFAVATRHGAKIENKHFASHHAAEVFRKEGFEWISRFNRNIGDSGKSDLEKNCEMGQRFIGDHPRKICERILALEGIRYSSMSEEEVVQRAFTSLYLPRVFGPMIALQVIQAYEELEDSTTAFVDEQDNADFRPVEAVGIDYTQGMRRHVKGTQAKEVGFAEFGEFFQVDRFTGRFAMDEMDIINDQIGVGQMAPDMLGQMARQLGIDLIYAILLSNPTLRDGTALFHSTRNNIVTAAPLTVAGLTAVATRMSLQRVTMRNGNTRTLNSQLGMLVTSIADNPDARNVTRATNVQSGATTAGGVPDMNPHAGRYQVFSDGRIDNGVENPRTEAFVAGTATDYFAFERPQGRPRTLVRAHLRGTGRVPRVRSTVLNDGSWGIAWDVSKDIGAGIKTFRGVVRATKT